MCVVEGCWVYGMSHLLSSLSPVTYRLQSPRRKTDLCIGNGLGTNQPKQNHTNHLDIQSPVSGETYFLRSRVPYWLTHIDAHQELTPGVLLQALASGKKNVGKGSWIEAQPRIPSEYIWPSIFPFPGTVSVCKPRVPRRTRGAPRAIHGCGHERAAPILTTQPEPNPLRIPRDRCFPRAAPSTREGLTSQFTSGEGTNKGLPVFPLGTQILVFLLSSACVFVILSN